MAKNNNLTDFLTDIADAIREKKGTSALIDPQDFSDEIASIETEPDYTDTLALLDRLEDAVGEYILANLLLTANGEQLETADGLILAFSEGE